MNLNKLSIKELFFLYLTDDMNRKPNQSYQDASSIYFDELKVRIGDVSDSIAGCVESARARNFISDLEHEEILTAIKIRNINNEALQKLGK